MKVLISDFDKTFYRDNYYSNIDRVNKFVDEGNMFVIATGRNISSLLKDIGSRPVKYEYLICNDGGVILNKNLEVIIRRDIDSLIVEEICDILEKSDAINCVYIDNGVRLIDNKDTLVNGIISDYTDYIKADKLLSMITEKYPKVHGYLSENWLNITSHEVSKGTAIEYLAEILCWNKDNIYVAGDNINDVSMFERYKGFAMADGHDDLKKVSHDIVNEFNYIFKLLKKKRD